MSTSMGMISFAVLAGAAMMVADYLWPDTDEHSDVSHQHRVQPIARRCFIPAVRRTVEHGPNSGREFWSCEECGHLSWVNPGGQSPRSTQAPVDWAAAQASIERFREQHSN